MQWFYICKRLKKSRNSDSDLKEWIFIFGFLIYFREGFSLKEGVRNPEKKHGMTCVQKWLDKKFFYLSFKNQVKYFSISWKYMHVISNMFF